MAKYIHRTAVFTIHNPTRRTRAVLDHAFLLYTQAYTTVLHHFTQYTVDELHAMAIYDIDDQGEQLTSTKQLTKSLFSHRRYTSIDAVLSPLEGTLRESLKAHVAETLLSYVALSLDPKQTPSYPERLRPRDLEPSRLEALDRLRTLDDCKKVEDELGDQLQRTRQSEVVSIPFCRIDADRNCGLFYNPDTKQFYARLFVVSPKSRHAQPLTISGQYIDVRTGTIYTRKEDVKEGQETFGMGKGSIMVLLEMGKWHEQMLRYTEYAFLPQKSKDGKPATPVSAHLVKTEKGYQLHVSFQFPKPKRIQAQTLLGVDRGITCLAAGAVTSLDGKQVLETFIADGTELRTLQKNMEQIIRTKQAKGQVTKGDKRRAHIADQHVHACANQIVELAIKYQSQIVMEDLSGFAAPRKHIKGQVRSNFNAMLPRRQYQKVLDAVNIKLTLIGLPPVRLVSAWHTSLTCTNCGCISKESRSTEDRTQFKCIECGFTMHADKQAGINIARKVLWLTLRGKEKQKETPEAQRTTWASFAQNFKA